LIAFNGQQRYKTAVVDGGQNHKRQVRAAGRARRGRYGARLSHLDRELNKIVALKIIHEALSNNKSAIEMFKREASVCLELTHPNIVRLYNLELENNRLFLVMEYVDGPDLYEILRKKRRFELHEVIAIMRPLLEGLGAAHAEGVVHLDIKPENLIISKEGILKSPTLALPLCTASRTLKRL
jgi:serine/threonine-protein kinase